MSGNTALGTFYFLIPGLLSIFYDFIVCIVIDFCFENVCFLLLPGSFLYVTLIMMMMMAGQDTASLCLGHSLWWMPEWCLAWCLNDLQSIGLEKTSFLGFGQFCLCKTLSWQWGEDTTITSKTSITACLSTGNEREMPFLCQKALKGPDKSCHRQQILQIKEECFLWCNKSANTDLETAVW